MKTDGDDKTDDQQTIISKTDGRTSPILTADGDKKEDTTTKKDEDKTDGITSPDKSATNLDKRNGETPIP